MKTENRKPRSAGGLREAKCVACNFPVCVLAAESSLFFF